MTPQSIARIDRVSVNSLNSGQTVVDLQTALKELVENALDANASNIEVRFVNHGADSFEVIDNGHGISQDNYETVALKHYTSKLAQYDDLTSVSTFGFRGEAISSLCALSSSLVITTATAEDSPMGTILEFDRLGRTIKSSGKVARQRGTTVSIKELFSSLPVRRKEFVRNAKQEYAKAISLLQSYALVPCTHRNGGVRLTVSNQPTGGRKTIQFQTDGALNLRNSVSSLWGSQTLKNLTDLNLTVRFDLKKSRYRLIDPEPSNLQSDKVEADITGLISKWLPGCGRNNSDRQFIYINGRPFNDRKIQKAFNEVYKTFNVSQSPILIANLQLNSELCDVNVTPDKRTIMIQGEESLVAALKTGLEEEYSPSRSTFEVNNLNQSNAPPLDRSTGKRKERSESCMQPADGKAALQKRRREIPSDTQSFSQDNIADVSDVFIQSQHTASFKERALESADTRDCPLLESLPSSGDFDAFEGNLDDDNASITQERSTSPLDWRSSSPPPIILSIPVAWHGEDSERSPRSQTVSTTKRSLGEVFTDKHKKADLRQSVLDTSKWTSAAKDKSSRNKSQQAASNADVDKSSIPHSAVSSGGRRASDSSSAPLERHSNVTERQSSSRSTESSNQGHSQSTPIDLTYHDLSEDELDSAHQHRATDPRIVVLQQRNEGTSSSKTTGPLQSGSHENIHDMKPKEFLGENLATHDSHPVERTVHVPRAEVFRTIASSSIILPVDLGDIDEAWSSLGSSSGHSKASVHRPEAVTDEELFNSDVAEAQLSRVIQKTDFETMEVLGQFNLGFILVRRRPSSHPTEDDVFIVDQHAADEKYNFEDLQAHTRIDSQKLISPLPLDLSVSEELLVLEHKDVLHANGFKIETRQNADGREGVFVATLPVSKSVVFGPHDLQELVHLLDTHPSGSVIRSSKARAMFASRACRKSVMIGHALSKEKMTTVIRHMSGMDQPWNCPHGRPTMRHLASLTDMPDRTCRSRQIRWSNLRSD